MSEQIPELPDYCWPVDTTELAGWDDWAIEPEPEADPPVEGVKLYSEVVKARAESLAGQSMRLLCGFRVGGCPVTVRPCRRDCNTRTWGAYPVRGYAGSTPWFPVSLGGQWLNVSCCDHSGGCSCSASYEVALPSAVSAVDEVLIDGEVLAPSSYQLRPGGRLVRIDGERWPLEQDLNAPDTEPGTWSVTYVPGAPVDGLGAVCAGLLALEYAKALNGDDCDLPTTVTQVVRLGVTMTLAPGSFPEGKTGIRIVDDYVTRWNPYGHLASPAAVYNIDQG
jgi:hypothetical protein